MVFFWLNAAENPVKRNSVKNSRVEQRVTKNRIPDICITFHIPKFPSEDFIDMDISVSNVPFRAGPSLRI